MPGASCGLSSVRTHIRLHCTPGSQTPKARVVTRSIDPWGRQLNPRNGNLHHQSAQADNVLTSRPSLDSKHSGCNAPTVPAALAGVNLTSADCAALESRRSDRALAERACQRCVDALAGGEII